MSDDIEVYADGVRLPLEDYWIEARSEGDRLLWCPDFLTLDQNAVVVGEPMEGPHLSDLVGAVVEHQRELDEAVSAEDAYFELLRAMDDDDES